MSVFILFYWILQNQRVLLCHGSGHFSPASTDVLTVGGLPDDREDDLVLWSVVAEDSERRVGDDDSGVFLHVDAADGHHRLPVLFTLEKGSL